jgi:hypothetical protein
MVSFLIFLLAALVDRAQPARWRARLGHKIMTVADNHGKALA